jgi:hypothetical protein
VASYSVARARLSSAYILLNETRTSCAAAVVLLRLPVSAESPRRCNAALSRRCVSLVGRTVLCVHIEVGIFVIAAVVLG